MKQTQIPPYPTEDVAHSPDLLQAYDAYKDLNRNAFFTVCFGGIPSGLRFEGRVAHCAQAMEEVLAMLEQAEQDLELVYKYWSTNDAKNALASDDFPYECLLKSDTHSLLVWVHCSDRMLQVEFFYDVKDNAVEDWVKATNQKLRTRFGEVSQASFKVLSRKERCFFIQDVETNNFREVDIDKLYNDDFQAVDARIRRAIAENRSGLILLHGMPGTGKTSYIKHLISRYKHKPFIFVQNEFVRSLLKPDFISFLLRNRDSVFIIEDAEKVILSREQTGGDSVVSTILQLTDGLFSDYLNTKIICTFNTDLRKVDEALLRKGRLIAMYEFKALAKEKAQALAQSLEFDGPDKPMTLADIFQWKEAHHGNRAPRTIGFQQAN